MAFKSKQKIIYPELSYNLIGIAFKVYNQLGYGYQEKYYQRAYEYELKKERVQFEKEKVVKINYDGKCIGRYFLDFIVENKIVVELKIASEFKYKYIRQVLEYLTETKVKLAILIYFTKEGVRYRRIVNPKINID
jgi:GxxExxY protein